MIKVKTEQAKTTLTTTHSSVQLEGEIQGCHQQDSVPVWHQGVMVEGLDENDSDFYQVDSNTSIFMMYKIEVDSNIQTTV